MSTVKIRGIDVKFPYEKPYDIQVSYMEKVLECLDDKRHGVLESPTGTGKTLCLFAPVTSWLRSKKNSMAKPEKLDPSGGSDPGVSFRSKKQRVWYTARTHSQIAQTVAEVRRCDVEGLSIRVMGAREQLCVNPVVTSEKDNYIKTVKCKELVKTRSCRFHRNLDFQKHAPTIYQPGEVLDIEDLAQAGRSCGVCPYYLAKTAKDTADVVLMPYNYVIDRESRGSTEAQSFQNDIVIFDEGHNVPNTCEGSFEFSISSVDLALGLKNIQDLMEVLAKQSQVDADSEDSVDFALHSENCMQLATVLKGLEAGLAGIPISSQLYPLADLFSFFEKAGANEITALNLLTSISGFQNDSIRLQLNGPTLTTFSLLEKMFQTLFGTAIRTFTPEMVEKSFKFAVSEDGVVRNSKKLSLFCFNPSFGIKEVLLLGVQSMIITSGTLSPLRSFIYELGLPDPVTLENPHIATRSQVPFMVLGTGVNNVRMDASFKNRKEPAFMYSLGMSLTNLISSVPDGVLLLFSSYYVMQNLQEYWEAENIWKRLNSIKRVFVEPRGKEEFINCMENYRRAIDAGNGAVLMGVLRGKISEGMDFKDQYCRAVFVVGVPFPPFKDPRVEGKQKYAETLFIQNPVTKRNEKLYGNGFSSVEAMKATNQAIGRVIRHGGDYGAIVLVDYRFAWPKLMGNISHWLRGNQTVEVNFSVAKKSLREFFRNIHLGNLGVPEVRCQAVNGNGDPIAGDIKFEMYDHKTARFHAPAPWLASGSGENYERVERLEKESPDSGVDLLSRYGAAGSTRPRYQRMNAWSSPKAESTSQCSRNIQPKSEPGCFLEALQSADVKPPHSYTAYREVDLSVLAEVHKRKVEETSPSLLSSQKKKSCRSVAVDMATHEPEPESVATAPPQADTLKVSVKADLINYFVKARNVLPDNEKDIFKETAWQYLKGVLPLNATMAVIKKLLANHRDLLLGFSICVRAKDRNLWEEIINAT